MSQKQFSRPNAHCHLHSSITRSRFANSHFSDFFPAPSSLVYFTMSPVQARSTIFVAVEEDEGLIPYQNRGFSISLKLPLELRKKIWKLVFPTGQKVMLD